MNQYPNQGQDPNQPQPGTQYGGYTPPANPQQYNEQPPYQQPPYQQGEYQQPYQQQVPPYQAPYQQAPYPKPTSFNMDYRIIIAGTGAIVALIAFFLPYVSYSYLGYTGGSVSGTSLAGADGRYWLDFLVALVALGIVVLLQFGQQWFRTTTTPFIQRVVTSLTTTPRSWYIWLITAGAIGVFLHILDLGKFGWGVGLWFNLLGFIAVIAGGVLFIRPLNTTSTTVPPIR